MEDLVFKSSIWRFGPIITPQYFSVTENGIEYCKLKIKNYLGVSPDIAYVEKRFINGVFLKSHFFTGTEIVIEYISGKYLHLRNFSRRDAEYISDMLTTDKKDKHRTG